MKKRVNSYTNSRIKSLVLLVFVFLTLFSLSSTLFFKDYRNSLIKTTNKDFDLSVNYLNTYLNKNIFLYKSDILSSLNKQIDLNSFRNINIDFNRYIFNKDTLVFNTQGFDDRSWKIAEIAVDAKYGYIKKIENSSLYEFVASNSFNNELPINIRYQVYKNGQIRNFLTSIDFSNKKLINGLEGKEFFKFVDYFLDFDLKKQSESISFEGQNIAIVTYKLNDYEIRKQLQNFITKLVIYTLIMVLPILFIVAFYHRYVFNKYVLKPMNYLNLYLDNIIGNKYRNIEKDNFEGEQEIIDVIKKIGKISSKIASLTNELNINKESLELKVSTDTLTGLPNKNIFDFDLKNMFVSLSKAYIMIVKIDDLSKLSANHDTGYINNFIEHYVSVIKNTIYRYSKTDIKIYRFYGSQFAIVAKNIDTLSVNRMCKAIVADVVENMKEYHDNSVKDIIQIGGTSFDLYGTIDSVLALANKAYDRSKKKGPNSFHVFAQEDIEKDYEILDNNVSEIIEQGRFELDFVLETYLFDDPKKLIMAEVAPLLYDHDNNKILIGSFVSVAQKLELIGRFDELVIEKTIAYINKNSIEHELAVNVSFTSIIDYKFMNWLKEYFNKNKKAFEKVVFSITSYSANLHKSDFINFVEQLHDLGGKIILKRYKTEEFPLEQLSTLKIDYIRIHKDYTTSFTNDSVKKHKVKNILIYGELNDINVIADTVKLDLDYNLLDRLGAYGTSR